MEIMQINELFIRVCRAEGGGCVMKEWFLNSHVLFWSSAHMYTVTRGAKKTTATTITRPFVMVRI